MSKLSKVIAGLECCADLDRSCESCPYEGAEYCEVALMKDALVLLKVQKSGDLIRLSDLMEFPIRIDHYDKVNGNEHFVYGVETVLEYAEYLPRVEAEPVVRAYWEKFKHPSGTHGIRCSHCKTMNGRRSKRCPNCGAHMDEEESE